MIPKRAPRSRAARRDDARPRRVRGVSPAAHRRRPHARAVPHGPRLHRGQGPRPHAGRRRLPAEAVQPRRVDRPRPGSAAPHVRRPGIDQRAGVRRPGDGRRRPPGPAGRRGRVAVADRVQPASLPADQPGPGGLQGADPRSRVALRLRRRRQRRRDLHRLPAPQGRPRRAEADPHAARRRATPCACSEAGDR